MVVMPLSLDKNSINGCFVARTVSDGNCRLRDTLIEFTGVMEEWNPLPRFYAAADVQAFERAPQIFLPFQRAIDLKVPTAGSTFCTLNYQGKGWDDLVRSECTWISFWVECMRLRDKRNTSGCLLPHLFIK